MHSSLQALAHLVPKAKTLGWFGFSADPPTLAHRDVVSAVLESRRVDRIVVLPAGKLLYKNFIASDDDRLEMMRLWKKAAGFAEEVIISRADLERERAFFWIDLWKSIQELKDFHHFLIVGSDQYQQISSSWHQGKELLKRASFLIVPREGFPVSSSSKEHLVIDCPPIQGSSTLVRRGSLQGVDEDVKAYILASHLYGL